MSEKFEKKPYLSDRRMMKEDVQLLFTLRTRMTNCKSNFKQQYVNNMKCRICASEGSVEDEDHILICPALTDGQTDVYGDIDSQLHAVKVFKKVLRKRQVYLDMKEKQT